MSGKLARAHFQHMLAAFRYSLQGLNAAARSETAFIQEIAALLCLPAAAFLYGVPLAGILIVVAGWLLVMAFELLNMAIESVCNLVSPGVHPLVKIAKDAGSAAVFIAISGNAFYWVYLIVVY